MLNIHNLSKQFGENKAVDDVSFEIKSGEIFSLIGPNGSGKTTVVKTVAGLLMPSSGSIHIGGFDSQNDPLKAKALLGYIPDEPAVWSGMTGEEFLHFSGALYQVSEDERIAKIPDLLSIFNLNGIEKELFEDYSRGIKQKFSILAALLHEPKLLLIDEPIVGLDPESAEIAKKKFAEFAKQGGAVLLVTHTLPVAEEISSHIGVLEKGRLLEVGTLKHLREKAKLSHTASLNDIYKALV